MAQVFPSIDTRCNQAKKNHKISIHRETYKDGRAERKSSRRKGKVARGVSPSWIFFDFARGFSGQFPVSEYEMQTDDIIT